MATHYVDNKKLLAAMIEYRDEVKTAQEADEQHPKVPSYVGECIMKIAVHLSHRANFTNYPFKEDMISDGIENCLQYIDNFDPKKSSNPFAYFTQIIYYAFIRRIQREKKYLYTKHAATQMAEITSLTSATQDHDTSEYKSNDMHGEWSQEQMLRFMEDFENSKRKRKRKKLTSA
jgi:DNA-directed RNA polymerase specialized sigma subunit